MVQPRHPGDAESKFEGEGETLVVAIQGASTSRVQAYAEAIGYLQAIRKRELERLQALKMRKINWDV
jgi:hypothetical protein